VLVKLNQHIEITVIVVKIVPKYRTKNSSRRTSCTRHRSSLVSFWHIGREVVEAPQQADERAAYGNALIERLTRRLTDR
jgi:hypothetical protein